MKHHVEVNFAQSVPFTNKPVRRVKAHLTHENHTRVTSHLISKDCDTSYYVITHSSVVL